MAVGRVGGDPKRKEGAAAWSASGDWKSGGGYVRESRWPPSLRFIHRRGEASGLRWERGSEESSKGVES